MSTETVGALGAIVVILAGVVLLRFLFLALFRPGRRTRGAKGFGITLVVALAVLTGLGLQLEPGVSPDGAAGGTQRAEKQSSVPNAEPLPSITLGKYAELDEDARTDFIERAMKSVMALESTLPDFRNCMGNMAFEKSGNLDAKKVFGWCDVNRKTDPELFRNYFNELAAKDLSLYAVTRCRDLVRDELIAPSSADFPWVPDQTAYKRRNRYFVSSHLDAQNQYGAMIRLRYECDVQYDGTGDKALASSWKVHHLNVFRP